MARSYARLWTEMWVREDWRRLSVEAQHLYLVLLSSPTLSYCGMADWRPGRIASNAAGWTAEDVQRAGKELSDALFLVIDESTEEALIRTFVRHDGVMKEARVAVSMCNAYAAMSSSTLRGVVVHELQRLWLTDSDLKGWRTVDGKRGKAQELLTNPSIDPASLPKIWPYVGPTEDLDRPSVGPSLPVVSTKASAYPGPTEDLRRGSTSPEPKPLVLPLPDEWWPSEDDVTWVEGRRPDLDVMRVAEIFREHQRAKGAQRADWSSAFREWVLKERAPVAQGAGSVGSPAAPANEKPKWCGNCIEETRLYEAASGAMARCGTCHPLEAGRFD